MAFRIVLCGANSVGKTTLAEDFLEKHPGKYNYLVEVARDVMTANSISSEDVRESLKTPEKATLTLLQNLIFEEQNRQELALGDCKAIVSDRGPDPLAFMHQLNDEKSADELSKSPAAAACLERYRHTNCLVVVVGLLKTVVDDGFRMVQEEEEQREFTECLYYQLNKHNIRYGCIKETDRKKRVLELERLIEGE